MNARQLKSSILQLAVSGKLVPQNPTDEPAATLLKRIRAEKERLIKSGKIKREKRETKICRKGNSFYEVAEGKERCIDDELPFEIPESWEWARLRTFCELTDGEKKIGAVYPILDTNFLRNRGNFKYSTNGKYVTKGEKLILVDGENSGEVFIAPQDGYLGSTFKKLWISEETFEPYVLSFIEFYRVPLKNSKRGAAIPHLNKEMFFNLLLPLPPLEEQRRIVEKLETILPFVEKYGEVEKLLDGIDADFPERLKKSVLQLAVQGKLVPQNPADEPAAALLKKIRAEKNRLVQSGKLKRDKTNSVIRRSGNSFYETTDKTDRNIDEELPFEIPESWEWIRLNDLGEYRKGPFGSSLTKNIFVPKSSTAIKIYEQKNAIKKDHTLGNYYITEDYFINKMSSFQVQPGDIIVSCAGTIGETYVLPENIERGIINQALMRIRLFAPINVDYFLMYFDYMLKETAKSGSKGSAIKNIPPFSIFKQLLIPLPPLAEQKRIVEKIEEILPLIENLQQQ